jgi:hypothetical protein
LVFTEAVCQVCINTRANFTDDDHFLALVSEQVLGLMRDEAEFVDKFRKFKRTIEVSRNPNARWCIKYAICNSVRQIIFESYQCCFPVAWLDVEYFRPGCDNFMIGSRHNPKMVCPDCHTSVCFECSQAVRKHSISRIDFFIFIEFECSNNHIFISSHRPRY